MNYTAELQFFQSTLKNWYLNSVLLTETMDLSAVPDMDLGLRRLLFGNEAVNEAFLSAAKLLQPNTIYSITDTFLCSYIFLQLPDTEQWTGLLIGPFISIDIGKQQILHLLEQCAISPDRLPQVEDFYANIPILFQDGPFYAMLNTFGARIWGGTDMYVILNNEHLFDEARLPENTDDSAPIPSPVPDLMMLMEQRYEYENKLLHAVSQGQHHRAESMLNSFTIDQFEQRLADPIRDSKNYMIIMNTLLRKAAEQGSVHPYHIDKQSSYFAKKIEQINSRDAVSKIMREMLHKYTLLVRNHSLKAYSLPIQKVITRIDTDLTADLTLKAQADFVNVNPSYLSALFKKETGATLTDYVNQKRVEYAILLLNSTTMQIQTIASHCGIPDVNYFTKIFKKHIGKTPREYRAMIVNPNKRSN